MGLRPSCAGGMSVVDVICAIDWSRKSCSTVSAVVQNWASSLSVAAPAVPKASTAGWSWGNSSSMPRYGEYWDVLSMARGRT